MSILLEVGGKLADVLLTFVVLKATLMAGVLVLLLRATRRASASVRAGLCTLAFAVLLVAPVLSLFVPWWELGLVRFPVALFDWTVSGAAARAGTAGAGAADGLVALVPGGIGDVPVVVGLASLWSGIAVVLLLQFVLQRVAVERIARSGRPVRAKSMRERLARLCAETGIGRRLRLVWADLPAGPATFGLIRPTIVLPTVARHWTPERLDAVLRHELAHVRRGDYAAIVLAEIARALYWPNPAVWLIATRLRHEIDRACDDAVLRAGIAPYAYARCLLDVARSFPATDEPATVSLARHHGLRDRIRAIMDGARDRRPASMLARVPLVAGAILAALTLGSTNIWSCPFAPHTPSTPAPPVVASEPDAPTPQQPTRPA